MSEKNELLSLRYEELESLITAMGEGKFRAKQVFEWLKRGGADNITVMLVTGEGDTHE